MKIEEIYHDNFVTLKPIGELDANSSINMNEKIEYLLGNSYINIHVDCSELRYISSAGLGVFMSFIEEIQQAGGKFIFSNMSNKVFNVFELLGLHQVMTIVKDYNEVESLMV
ncbi:MAG: STAS domain-containing protein [Bacteroidia bacterium]|nr:STAS domain-containing protein [Bacteroidia bacterium]